MKSPIALGVENTFSSCSVVTDSDGTSVPCDCANALPAAISSIVSAAAIIDRIGHSRRQWRARLDCVDVHFGGDAASEQIDGDNEPSFCGFVLNENAFDAGEWSFDHPHAIAVF